MMGSKSEFEYSYHNHAVIMRMHGEYLVIGRQHEHAWKCADRNVLLGYYNFA